MKPTFYISILLLFLFLSFSYVNSADLESANQLYIKSGLEKQMLDIGPALLAGYKNNYTKSKNHSAHDKKIYQNIAQTIENSFDIQTMRKRVVTGIMAELSDLDMERILDWLDSSDGKKITILEEKAGSKEGMEETQRYIRNFKKTSVSEERIRLIKELNSSMNITETTIQIALSTQFALLMTLKKPEKKLSLDDAQELYEDFKKNRSQLEPTIKHQVHGSLLYTYRNLPDKPLENYVIFIKSESGRKYSSVTSTFIVQAITESSLKFASEISQL